ncbi:MAG TPA: 2-oxo acid dehydrogenase subunit E2 [Casimicrobiaceae bacterium]|nr:2-oxo acid dehydrogenase subunit E2 [Casimicrobiaceae bacterium]
MASPLHVPRVNNNDDSVRIVAVGVKEGEFVRRGQIVGAVETDKAVLDVPSERDGYVLKILHRTGETANVGSVLLWLGDAATERAPEEAAAPRSDGPATDAKRPTAKAQAMLRELGLDASAIASSGERLTVSDIEAWLARARSPAPAAPPAPATEPPPDVPGEAQALSPEERAMLVTVGWHRDRAVPAYLEIEYDPKPWTEHAARYAAQNKLLFSPLLPLMAFRLVEIAKANPRINATIAGERRYQYGPINLGFTVQAGTTLYLAVVRDAHAMDTARFVDALGEVQRHAVARKLGPSEAVGATLSFSSMARWEVARHTPVIPPNTGLIVAHASPRASGLAVLGASYDHRLLTGFDAVSVLRALAQPAS